MSLFTYLNIKVYYLILSWYAYNDDNDNDDDNDNGNDNDNDNENESNAEEEPTISSAPWITPTKMLQ